MKNKFNAFEGVRYKDYDDLDMKKILFNGKKFVRCKLCKRRIKKISDGFYGYNLLFCKKCFSKFCEQADKELDRAFKHFF